MNEAIPPQPETTKGKPTFLDACYDAIEKAGDAIYADFEAWVVEQPLLHVLRKVPGQPIHLPPLDYVQREEALRELDINPIRLPAFNAYTCRWRAPEIKPKLHIESRYEEGKPFGCRHVGDVILPYTNLFDVTEDGVISFNEELRSECSLDEEAVLFRLEQPQELIELVDFWVNVNPNSLLSKDITKKNTFEPITLERLFSGLHLVVWVRNNERCTVELTGPGRLDQLPTEFKSLAEAELFQGKSVPEKDRRDGWDGARVASERAKELRSMMNSEPCLTRITQIMPNLWRPFPDFGFVWRKPGPVYGRPRFSAVMPWDKFLECTPQVSSWDQWNDSVYLAPNIKKSSVLFLHEYFTYTQEGQAAIRNVFDAGSLDEMVEKFRTQKVPVPVSRQEQERFAVGKGPGLLSRLEQIRFAIELRATRSCLEDELPRLIQATELAGDILDRTKRKLKNLSILSSSYQQEVDSLLQPLPYPIERPYRDFMRADPGYDKAHAGVSCAGQIFKAMACLAIEEFEYNWPKFGTPKPERSAQKIADIDSGKPFSDGSWLDLFRVLFQEAHECLPVMAVAGKSYYDNIEKAAELVNPRNKWWAHPSETSRRGRRSDIRNLETERITTLSDIIDVLREGFKNVELLIPLKSWFDEQRGQVFEARLAMGYESEFIIVEKPLPEGMELYVGKGNQLVMYSGNKFFPLRKYFKCEEKEKDGYFEIALKI